MPHRIVWVDIPARDLSRAMTFYSKVLEIEIEEAHPGVAVLSHTDSDVAGCLFVDPKVEPSTHGPLIYLNAQGRLEEATQTAVEYGGKVLEPPHAIGPWGSRSVVLDSEGNRIALHSA